jgi:hypothetical protein
MPPLSAGEPEAGIPSVVVDIPDSLGFQAFADRSGAIRQATSADAAIGSS